MKTPILILLCLAISFTAHSEESIIKRDETLRYANLVNDYFMRTYPDVGAKSYVGGGERSSKIWTRGVYYEGLMAFYKQYPQEKCLKYALDWGEFHKWISSDNGSAARHADYQCCGQAYLDMYMLDPTKTIRKNHIKKRIDDMLATDVISDWHWVDAIQMSMPIFAQLGSLENDERYFKRMYEMYMYTRNKQGGSGKGGGSPLFNTSDGLWYRDYRFDSPYKDTKETDKPCYWSRGNGWAYVALARVLQYSPENVYQRQRYISDFKLMSEALLKCQRPDGFWGVSLAAQSNTGHIDSPGPETSGTALFIMGMAFGINEGILDRKVYLPSVVKAWNALCKVAVNQETGFLGYVQGAGACPEDGQPVLHNKAADFEDFGIGCFLLAASEIYRMGDVDLNDLSSIENNPLEDHFTCYTNNNRLTLNLTTQKEGKAYIGFYNISGILRKKIYDDKLFAGKHTFDVSTENMSGVHICTVKTSDSVISRKIILP